MESDLNLYLDCILMSTSKESQRRSLCALAELLSTNGMVGLPDHIMTYGISVSYLFIFAIANCD